MCIIISNRLIVINICTYDSYVYGEDISVLSE